MSGAAVPHSNTPNPLTPALFDKLMEACGAFPPSPRFAVALSGGPDSIALAYLLHDWVTARGGTLHAITVDHQLRPESGEEAAQVAKWCAAKSIAHTTLVWKKDCAPTSAVHHTARRVRYEFLTSTCQQHGIDHLFLGQHADDQAETVLMRFIKGSGIDGLAAMPRMRTLDGVKIIRPLLPVTKQRLVDTCKAHQWAFFRDPSNDSPAYLRGRLRQLAQPLAQEGLTTASLYDMARNAGMARAALEATANQWLERHAVVSPLGIIHIERKAWAALDTEMQRRTLSRILLCMSGEDYSPKYASLDHLVQSLLNKESVHQTLCGCHVIVQFGVIKFYRELACTAKAQPIETTLHWDNRFKIVVNSLLPGKHFTIAPLGELGRELIEKMGHRQVADCPALHRATLPALYVDNQLHSIPDFGVDEHTSNAPQPLVKAIFSPKRMLLVNCFEPCPVLLS